jgi:hypothetical protein
MTNDQRPTTNDQRRQSRDSKRNITLITKTADKLFCQVNVGNEGVLADSVGPA